MEPAGALVAADYQIGRMLLRPLELPDGSFPGAGFLVESLKAILLRFQMFIKFFIAASKRSYYNSPGASAGEFHMGLIVTLALVCTALVGPFSLLAQERGSLVGDCSRPPWSQIQDASVGLIHIENGITFQSLTNSSGA
jgi:hypothetical protein